MTTIGKNVAIEQTKPGVRFHVLRDQERKEGQLNKYLNQCQLYKRVNPECYPSRSELIKEMYDEKKVMKNRTCRRKGAKEFNFKKQSANQIISNNKFQNKQPKHESKQITKRHFQHYDIQQSDEE